MNLAEQVSSVFSDNTWMSWVVAVVCSIAPAILMRIVVTFVVKRLRFAGDHTQLALPKLLAGGLNATRTWVLALWLFSLFVAVLDVNGRMAHATHVALAIITSYQFARWGLAIIQEWRGVSIRHPHVSSPASAGAINFVTAVAKGLLLTVILLLGLSNVGVNVSALVASLGVGSIAVGLAAQSSLADFFASLAILLDKPFLLGDFIIVGDKMGTVENIGVKTTRLRALSGEQLIFANKDLVGSCIQNYKRMYERRVVQKFSVPHSTATDQLERIPGWIRDIVKAEPKLRIDRINLQGFQMSSIDFELIYFVLDPDYNLHMNLQERMLLSVLKKFRAEGVRLAQTVSQVASDEHIARAPFLFASSEPERTM